LIYKQIQRKLIYKEKELSNIKKNYEKQFNILINEKSDVLQHVTVIWEDQ
jgi:hypothetical protein